METANWLAIRLQTLREQASNIADSRVIAPIIYMSLGALLASIIFLILTGLDGFTTQARDVFSWADDLGQLVGVELLGAALTFTLIEVVLHQRRKNEEVERERQRLLLQMGSPYNQAALESIRQLRFQGWLTDGSLQGANLSKADLTRAELENADLARANMTLAELAGANLQDAHLAEINLSAAYLTRATLWKSNLSGANLSLANLRKTDLFSANMQGAIFRAANLQQAGLELGDLTGADLHDADLAEADLSDAILIDANVSHTDLTGAVLNRADLTDADLSNSELQGTKLKSAKLIRTNLLGCGFVTIAALRNAESLQGCTLPEGTQLPDDDTWREAFDKWSEAATISDAGFIMLEAQPPD